MSIQKQTILVVEDDELVQAFLALHLENEGYDVCTAATGAEMIRSLSMAAPDLILLDLNLPDGDGLSLASQVRQHSNIPIIIATTRSNREDRLMGLGIGADDYVTKPFDPKELLLRINNVLERTLPEGVSPPSRPPKPDGEVKILPTVLPFPVSEMENPQPHSVGWRRSGTYITLLLAIAGATAYWMFASPAPVQIAQHQADAHAQEKPAVKTRKSSPRFVPAPVQMEPDPSNILDQFSTAAGTDDALEEPQAQPLAELLGYGWVLNTQCEPIPQVKWWKYKTHESIAAYVTRKYEGDWGPYSKSWLRRMAKLQDIFERESSAVTRTGLVLKGKDLSVYLGQMQKRISVIHCLAGEAKRHSRETRTTN
ncbi:MAG: response regulator transcription factor [Alphaproteobacteria bacterium]|nr:response regulator transcription factor [Alphaproteobacteria bacterium]MBT7942277.1 response regulator transcription factor [Alphaproteobacteria bacterium]